MGSSLFLFETETFHILGAKSQKGFVDVGFAKGFQLKANQEHLMDENRNNVKSLRYHKLEEIESAVLEAVIKEAISLYK